jgi:hypothetical protein
MRKIFIAAAMALAAPAWGQSFLSKDRFTVSTYTPGTAVAIVGGSVEVQDPPFIMSMATPAETGGLASLQFNLHFAAQPGYVLRGEQVSFDMYMSVDTYGSPATQLVAPLASFILSNNGQPLLSEARDGGAADYRPTFTIDDPDLHLLISAFAREGLLCTVGHEEDGCGFGGWYHTLDSVVALNALRVTPLISAVPEPRTAGLYLAALAAFAAATVRRTRSR